jgi:hypothetical protein
VKIIPLTLKRADAFLAKHGRHYKTPASPICAIGVGDSELHGAAILGYRPNGDAELSHIYCDGSSQAYSLLYGACWRALKALGYVKAVL